MRSIGILQMVKYVGKKLLLGVISLENYYLYLREERGLSAPSFGLFPGNLVF